MRFYRDAAERLNELTGKLSSSNGYAAMLDRILDWLDDHQTASDKLRKELRNESCGTPVVQSEVLRRKAILQSIALVEAGSVFEGLVDLDTLAETPVKARVAMAKLIIERNRKCRDPSESLKQQANASARE